MSADWTAPSADESAEGPPPGTAPNDGAGPEEPGRDEPDRDELVVLDALEADLVAVEHAIAQLDDVTLSGVGGATAVDRIERAVSSERFGGPDEPELASDDQI